MQSDVPTILVAGVVRRLDRLRELGEVRRADLGAFREESARGRVDLAVVGTSPPHVDTLGMISHLKNDPLTAAIPVLHLVHSRTACVRCGADVCLSADESPDTMEGVARALVGLRRAQDELRTVPSPAGGTREAPGATSDVDPPAGGVAQAEPFLRLLCDAIPAFAYAYDVVEGRTLYVSPSAQRILGFPVAQLAAQGFPLAPGLVHPEDSSRVADSLAGSLAIEDEASGEREFRIRSADGGWRTLRSREVVVGRSRGRIRQLLGVAVDVTEERETRRMLERAQRLEALGRLTGAIAHDFNNMLGVILGHTQLTQRLLPSDHPASAGLEQVVKASDRAAELTRQLLAFSREPTRRPGALELNRVVGEVGEMLKRVIAEDVELEIRLGSGLGTITADRMEIEQILLNLAVNARDAMPAGGRLVLETATAVLEPGEAARLGTHSGRFVVLSVSDTGTGMDAATRGRIFEPFFTTKAEGKGSGLGLATVRGIVGRCGGTVCVESEPGRGATFSIYLPQVDPPVGPADVEAVSAGVPEGSETVLLVEDSDSVREVTRELLEGLGYTVLSAAHGAAALSLASAHPGPIHVLLTDVVMPRLGGGTLAAEMATLRPDVHVLYMSGYASGELPGPASTLLQKPFTRDRLALALRAAIDGSRRG
jgi:PAS domain S-box-containing protein